MNRDAIFAPIGEPSFMLGEDSTVWYISSRKGLPFNVTRTLQNKASS